MIGVSTQNPDPKSFIMRPRKSQKYRISLHHYAKDMLIETTLLAKALVKNFSLVVETDSQNVFFFADSVIPSHICMASENWPYFPVTIKRYEKLSIYLWVSLTLSHLRLKMAKNKLPITD